MKSDTTDHSTQLKLRLMEWQVCEDERDWERARAVPLVNPALEVQLHRWMPEWRRRWRVRFHLVVVALVVAGGVLGGWWIWHSAQMGLDAIEAELRETVIAEVWTATQSPPSRIADMNRTNSQAVWDAQSLRIAMQLQGGDTPAEFFTEVEIRGLGQDWAVVEVHVQMSEAGPSYHQTRVYRQSDLGWHREEVTAVRWGQPRRIESTYFVFDYYALDHAAVTQAAAHLDDLYPILYGNFFAGPPAGEKQVIVVDPERATDELPRQTTPFAPVVVASPAATLAPAELAERDLLVQSLVLALLDKLTKQAGQHYNLSPQWLPLRNGIRLWLIWEQELPLAGWRKPVVTWVFGDTQSRASPNALPNLEFGRDLCADHHLWMRTPLEISIPVVCWRQAKVEGSIVSWRYHERLRQLPLPLVVDVSLVVQDYRLWPDDPPPESMAAGVALATVVEYAAATFGADRLPVLLAALPEHEQWDTLIPAVFDVSLAEFDSGWRAFIAERYGLDLVP